jgi:hypothetical protein
MSDARSKGEWINGDLYFKDVRTGHILHPQVEALTETIAASAFTDGGFAIGTYTMVDWLPVGAICLASKVLVPAGFIGDTSAALTIGDGSDADRYNTGTIDIFTTAAAGVVSGLPSGIVLQITAVRPVLTVTTGANFTVVLTTGGSIMVSIYFIKTAVV